MHVYMAVYSRCPLAVFEALHIHMSFVNVVCGGICICMCIYMYLCVCIYTCMYYMNTYLCTVYKYEQYIRSKVCPVHMYEVCYINLRCLPVCLYLSSLCVFVCWCLWPRACRLCVLHRQSSLGEYCNLQITERFIVSRKL